MKVIRVRQVGLFKPKLDVTIEEIISDKNGRYILSETLTDGKKFVFLNVYSPNDQTQQVQFLKELPHSILNMYANEKLVLGGDFNCATNKIDKRGGRPIEQKRLSSKK